MEEWKIWKENKLPKSHKLYALWEVSNYGNVKKNGTPYECRLPKNGYKVFGRYYGVHRAVAELFIPNPNNYNEVDHINGDRLDNRAINLQWCTHKQNCNNPITIKRYIEAKKGKYKGKNNPMYGKTGANRDRHRVYHDDGTYHYEKNL